MFRRPGTIPNGLNTEFGTTMAFNWFPSNAKCLCLLQMNFETMNGRLIQSENGSVCANGKWENGNTYNNLSGSKPMASFHIFKCLLSPSPFTWPNSNSKPSTRNMHKPGATPRQRFWPFHCVSAVSSLLESNQKPFSLFLLNFLFSHFFASFGWLVVPFIFSELFRFSQKPESRCHFHVVHTQDVYSDSFYSMYVWQSHSVPLRLYFTKLAKLLCTQVAVYSLALWLCNHFHLLDAPVHV